MNEEIHLSVEEIAAYHAGELAEAEEARVQDHLVGCPECTRMLLDLDALRLGADPADEAPEAEKEAFWRSLQPRLADASVETLRGASPLPEIAGDAPRGISPVSDLALHRSRRRLRGFQLLAATLAAAVIGLAVQNAALRQTVGDLSQPDLGAPVRNLSATATRDATEPAVVSLAPDDRFFTLVLSPADPHGFPDHEVVLEKDGAGEVWRGRGLRKNRYGTFSLILARRLTGPGDYTLRIAGIEGGVKRIVGEYHFRIETQ